MTIIHVVAAVATLAVATGCTPGAVLDEERLGSADDALFGDGIFNVAVYGANPADNTAGLQATINLAAAAGGVV